jgi:hypothetical protein
VERGGDALLELGGGAAGEGDGDGALGGHALREAAEVARSELGRLAAPGRGAHDPQMEGLLGHAHRYLPGVLGTTALRVVRSQGSSQPG